MKMSYNQDIFLVHHPSGREVDVHKIRRGSWKLSRMFMALLVTFVVFAAMQTFQLNSLLSDAKSVGYNLSELRLEQEIILTGYSGYLSRYMQN